MKKVAAITLFFFCIIVFSAAPPVLARDGVNAREASEGDMEDMKDFLLHLKRHRARISAVDSQIEFRNALRTDNGVWRHGDTYVITVNTSEGADPSIQAGDIIFFHAKYPSAVSGSLRHIPVFRNLVDMVEEAGGEAVCVPDDRAGGEGKHICAVSDSDTGEAGDSFIHVVGFDHDELKEEAYSKVLAACPDLSGKGWLSADMVDDEESLVRYLEGVVEHVSEQIALGQQSGNNVQGGGPLVRMIQLLSPLMPCWRMRPWESGSIYFYIVTDTDKMFGIFNGNSPQLQDKTLRLRDDNGVEIAERILEEVRREDDTPNRGFLTYLWDNPVVPGDEVVCEETEAVPGTPLENEGDNEDEEVFCEAGNPVPGRSTGTSVKRGYFIRTNFGVGETCDMEEATCYVVGSGIYPEMPEGGGSGGGGGCAIAAGSGNELEGAAFNLFLITAVLFLATSGKSRPGEKLLTQGLRARRKDRRR